MTKEVDSDSIGARLRLWRKHLMLNQREFSDLANVHVAMIRKYEANLSVPGGEMLIAFSKTGLDVGWLLVGRGEMRNILEEAMSESFLSQIFQGLNTAKRESLFNEFLSRVEDARQIMQLKEEVYLMKNTNRRSKQRV